MSSLILAIICLITTIDGEISLGTFQKEASLTVSNSNDSGASIHLLSHDTVINGSDWIITSNSTSHGPMDMLINLDNSWGFHPNNVSTLRIIMDGKTPISEYDRDLLASFSVNSSQYFSVHIRLDNRHNNSIGVCDVDNHPNQPLYSGISNKILHSPPKNYTIS